MNNKKQGHYCKVCGECKANEKFSGKGHSAHICKSCSSLSATEKSEATTLMRLHNMSCKRLNDADKKWLENRTKDKRPEVKELATEIYSIHFPYAKRNTQKKQLRLNEMIFTVNNTVLTDEYGDKYIVDCKFTLNRKENRLIMELADEEPSEIDLTISDTKALFNLLIHNYEIFCWEEDYCSETFDDEYDETEVFETEILHLEEQIPTFSVWLKYADGREQKIEYFDITIPDKVESLYWELDNYFEESEDEEPNFIEYLYQCSDLLEMAESLEMLTKSNDENQNQYIAASMFMDLSYLNFERHAENNTADRPYFVYNKSMANLKFFHSFITQRTHDDTSNNSIEYKILNAFSEYVKANITTPRGELVDIADINKMMIAIEEKYKLISLLSCNKKIKVLLLSNTHKIFNSICSAVCSSDNSNAFYYELYLFHCKDENSGHPAYIFLHELGHALQMHITHDCNKIPESFCIMSDEVIGKPLAQGAEAAEIFADAFALAMMRVFGWDSYNLFNNCSEGIETVFTEYMVRLIEFYCKEK